MRLRQWPPKYGGEDPEATPFGRGGMGCTGPYCDVCGSSFALNRVAEDTFVCVFGCGLKRPKPRKRPQYA